MYMTVKMWGKAREAEGYHNGRLEGIDDIIKALVDAGIVSKDDCDKELERYMREDFEEDDDDLRLMKETSRRKPVWGYDEGKMEIGRIKGVRDGIYEGVNIVVDAQLAKRKECNKVIKQYIQEQQIDQKLWKVAENGSWGETMYHLSNEGADFYEWLCGYNKGFILGVLEVLGIEKEGQRVYIETNEKKWKYFFMILEHEGYFEQEAIDFFAYSLVEEGWFASEEECKKAVERFKEKYPTS